MNSLKTIFTKRIMVFTCLVFVVVGISFPARAEMILTQREREYIAENIVLKAASIDGGAPLHYRDSKGVVRGIAVSVLEKIADMTGLIIEYNLYDSIEEALSSDPDILFGMTSQYNPTGMAMSESYLKSETILFLRSSLNSNKLEDKKYASIKGGTLPEGVKEENTIYFDNREETMDGVEKGKADYGYGNAYSIAFYTLQNGYKNIVSIPKGKEVREYCMGLPKENEVLLSIINKAIGAIDENQIQTLILDVASHVEQKITVPMIFDAYGREIFGIISLIIIVLLYSAVSNIHANRRLRFENKRYMILSNISNECLFEYDTGSNRLKLSDKCNEIFCGTEVINEVSRIIKDAFTCEEFKDNVLIKSLPVAKGRNGVFRVIKSGIYDDMGKLCGVIGKLIDISEEAAEKDMLITKSQLDGLTSLYNATASKELITQSIRNKDIHNTDAFLIIDVDNFKEVNDTFGHLKGNEILVRISNALKLSFRQGDILGRIGGDEFCVYLHDVPSADFVRTKCRQLEVIIKEQIQDVDVLISIGIAVSVGENTYEDLFKCADEALYQAKKQGGGRAVIYGD